MPNKKQSGPIRVSAPRAPVEPVGDVALTTTRIDPPHQVASAEPPAPQAIAAPAAEAALRATSQTASLVQPLAQSFEQMESQAAQLAAQLSKQQATLDRREAEVNARAAAVESQVRTARLWLVEKLEEIAQRQAELSSADSAPAPPAQGGRGPQAQSEHSLAPAGPATLSAARDEPPFAAGLSDIGATEGNASGSEMTAPRATLRFWKQLRWQEEFERWCTEREAAAEASATAATANDGAGAAGPARGDAASPSADRIRAANQQLAARAAELEAWRHELVADRDALEAEREAFFAERQADLLRLAEQRRVMSEKLWRQRARLRRRRDDFDAREMALRRLRADLLRTQQQALEMRLGAEELLAHTRGNLPADERLARANLRHPSHDARHEGSD